MWTLLEFIPRKESREPSSGNKEGIGSNVTQLITKTLPIDVEKIRWADNGIASFLSKLLLQEWVVNVALDEEELNIHSTLRVLLENGDSLELFLSEFIEGMREKPASMSHTDLKWYLVDILWRIWVRVIFDAYSPNITGVAVVSINEPGFDLLLRAAIVGMKEEWSYCLSIRTNIDPTSIATYPEEFKDPKETPVFLLAIQYFIRTLEDRNMSYYPDSPIEILFYHNGVIHIILTTYWELYSQTMTQIYESTPGYKSLKNDRIALQLFYNKHVIHHLR